MFKCMVYNIVVGDVVLVVVIVVVVIVVVIAELRAVLFCSTKSMLAVLTSNKRLTSMASVFS